MNEGDVKFSRAFTVMVLIILALSAAIAVMLTVRSCSYIPPVNTDVPIGIVTSADSASDGTDPGVSEREESGTVSPDIIRNEHSFNFLVVGIDRVAQLSDTIMVINYDTDTGKISVMQLPRDTYVCPAGMKEGKLNGTYATLGISGMRKLIEENLCIRIDYHAVVYLEAFAAAVDAVGGVTVDVPFDMKYSDPEQDLYIDLKAGVQTLDGDHALQFVRYRTDYAMGDLGRIDAQKTFMTAFLKKVRESLNLSTAEAVIGKVLPMIDTDLNASDCLYFAAGVLGGRGAEGLTMMTAPGRAISPASIGGSYYVISRSAVLKVVNENFNVFSVPVTDSGFDPDRIFVRKNDDDFERIYTYTPVEPQIVTGE